MKKDLTGHDELLDSRLVISKILPSEGVVPRAGWSESSKVIARDGDDYLRLGDVPNLEDQELEW
jgi:antitoxin MazE